ncbi:MAG: hypothetical protein ACC645_28500, partial [Pirellulales bacterium]
LVLGFDVASPGRCVIKLARFDGLGAWKPVVHSLSHYNVEKAGGDAMPGVQLFWLEDIRTTAFQGGRFVPLV